MMDLILTSLLLPLKAATPSHVAMNKLRGSNKGNSEKCSWTSKAAVPNKASSVLSLFNKENIFKPS